MPININNTLKPVNINASRPKSSLSYDVFNPKMYAGPEVLVSVPRPSVENEPIILVSDPTTQSNVDKKTLDKYTGGATYNPTETVENGGSGHQHYATEIIETKDRLFLSADEKATLRKLFANGGVAKQVVRTMVFVLGPDTYAGDTGLVLKFPFDGVAIAANATCSEPGIGITRVQIQRCPKGLYESNNAQWTTVASLEISSTKRYENIDIYELVTADDYFKVVAPIISINVPLTIGVNVTCNL